MMKIIHRLLRRETKYIAWKSEGCPSFERAISKSLESKWLSTSSWEGDWHPSWLGSKHSRSHRIPRNFTGKEEDFEKFIQTVSNLQRKESNFYPDFSEVQELARTLGEDVPTFKRYISVRSAILCNHWHSGLSFFTRCYLVGLY